MLRTLNKDTEHCFLTQFRHPDLAVFTATPSVRDSHPFCEPFTATKRSKASLICSFSLFSMIDDFLFITDYLF